jgi:hypothetical protein
VPERGVEPLCPFGQTGLSRPRIPFRHPGLGLMIKQAGERPRARSFCHSRRPRDSRAVSLPGNKASREAAEPPEGSLTFTVSG